MERATLTTHGTIAASRPSPQAENPEAYISGDRRRALAAGRDLPDRVRGAALFADISGFTALTESLAKELGPQRGAEELTAVLEVVFGAVLAELLLWGGVVIYFSGDAVTCWLDGDDGTRAIAAALDMQTAMARVGTVHTPDGTTIELAMKVAVAAGPARRFVVGDPQIQLIDVLAGALMDRLADAEQHAQPGEVVVDALTLATVADDLRLQPPREGLGEARVVAGLAQPASRPPLPPPAPRLPDNVVRQWLLPPVFERMQGGQGEFLAELRPAVPLFLRFGGIDYDHDDDARDRLDEFIRRAQHVVDGWGGNVLQLTVGDKGAYLYSVFGAPIAHEDDAARACAAALELRDLGDGGLVTDLQIGVAAGRLRSGTYGHRQRRTFCCLGDAVNLAARLMSKAPPGELFIAADVAGAAGAAFVFDELPDLTVKGKAAPIEVRRLTGRTGTMWSRRAVDHTADGQQLLGRTGELAILAELAERAAAGRGQVVTIAGEAGMGKSRLVAEAMIQLVEHNGPVLVGEASTIGTVTSYLAWRAIWGGLMALPSDDAGLVPALRTALADLDPDLLPRLPLLGAVFGITIDDSPLTATFDAKLRKSSLESLLLRCLQVRAERGPITIVLEDCHWLDPLSRDLLDLVSRMVAGLPVLVVLTHRPGSFTRPELSHCSAIELDRLDPESCRALVASRLTALYGPHAAMSEVLVTRLTDRADGNPFHLEELLNYLHAQQIDPSDSARVQSLELPTSLAALVLSRIDTLPERPRRTLKVASVVGREFTSRTLSEVYPAIGTARGVREHMRQLRTSALVQRDKGRRDWWAFRHAVVREVAYDSLPFALRTSLHVRVGDWYEQSQPDALDLLAHHFGRGDDLDRKRHYLVQAGEAAQAKFANEAAVGYFRDVAPLLEPLARVDVLIRLGTVLELTGEWNEAEAVQSQALSLAVDSHDARRAGLARSALADCLRKQGRFEEATLQIDAARELFGELDDQAGLARVGHLRGTLAAQTGDYQTARREYTASFAIREGLGDTAGMASLVSNLAIVAEYEGDFDEAQRLNEEALKLRTKVGDPQATAVSLNNLGMIALLQRDYATALTRCTEARRLTDQVGDTWLAAIADNNLGNASREIGEYGDARQHFGNALRAYTTLGDPWALAILYDDVAIMAARLGEAETAISLAAAAESLHLELGTPRTPSVEVELESILAEAGAALGSAAAGVADAGRRLGAAGANTLAEAFCGG